jgi:hypothetical protein
MNRLLPAPRRLPEVFLSSLTITILPMPSTQVQHSKSPEGIPAVARGNQAPLEIQDAFFSTDTSPSAPRAAAPAEGSNGKENDNLTTT